LSHPAECLP
jgi:hypothetical protein